MLITLWGIKSSRVRQNLSRGFVFMEGRVCLPFQSHDAKLWRGSSRGGDAEDSADMWGESPGGRCSHVPEIS